MSDSLQPCGMQPTRLLCPWDSPGKNTGVSCHALPKRIFLTQGLKHWQAASVPLAPPGKPRYLYTFVEIITMINIMSISPKVCLCTIVISSSHPSTMPAATLSGLIWFQTLQVKLMRLTLQLSPKKNFLNYLNIISCLYSVND